MLESIIKHSRIIEKTRINGTDLKHKLREIAIEIFIIVLGISITLFLER